MSEKMLLNKTPTEQTILGCFLSNPVTLEEVPYLQPEHFYRDNHQVIYQAMQCVYTKAKKLDTVLLTDELVRQDRLDILDLDAHIPYLDVLLNAAYVFGNVDEYGRKIVNAWRHRYLAQIARVAAQGSIEDNPEVFEELDTMMKIVQNDVSLSRGIVGHRQMVNDFMTDLSDDSIANRGISTGFAQVDMVAGGLQPGTLIVIAARPASGKTALALNLIDAALRQTTPDGQGHNVAFISLEMSDTSIIRRWLAQRAHVNTNRLRDKQLQDQQWSDIEAASSELLSLPGEMFTIRPKNNVLPYCRLDLLKLKRDHGVGMIVVDYLQKCKMAEGRDRQEKRFEVEEAVIWCRDLAIEFDIPVVCLAQLNRESDHAARPTIGNLGDSSAIEKEADTIFLIQRHVDANNPASTNWNATLILDKNRDGMKFDFPMHYIGAFTQFKSGSMTDNE